MTETENVAPQNNTNNVDEKIVRQLEYYFGNINLPRDKFLQDTIKNNDGWAPIKVLLTFNRLAAITTDVDAVSNAVKGSHSEIICLSEDGLKICRNTNNPLPENSLEYWQKIKHCTVYMKGFEQSTSLDEIMDYAKKYGNVENILMRRTKPHRVFKGSVFVTYKTRAEAEAAQKDNTKFGEIQLTKMMQDDYWTMKSQETKACCYVQTLSHFQAQARFVKGLILSVSGLPEDTTLSAVREFFKQFGDVGYVVYENGESKAEIRFAGEENGAQEAWNKAVSEGTDGKVIFQGKELVGKVLDGEEEEKYWSAFNASIQNKMDRAHSRRGGRGGRGRGAHGASRGQKRPAEEGDEPKSKKIIFEDNDGK
ncbi:hypothetical protein Angca_004825 [Angiostrongylus cantonensis]|nr:hypothetical protein Angca_004825 [Angiostrongylus cantonensis]